MNKKNTLFIFICVMLIVTGLTIGSVLLLRAGVCMLVMLVLSLASLILAGTLTSIDITPANDVLKRGDCLKKTISVRQMSPLPLSSISVKTGSGDYADFDILPFKLYKKRIYAEAEHVGAFRDDKCTAYFTDLFNLFVIKKNLASGGKTLIVLPKEFSREAPKANGVSSTRGGTVMQDDSNEPSDIRSWVDGDLLKRVHWKLTYKAFERRPDQMLPVVKVYEEAKRPYTLIIPDFSRIDAIEERRLTLQDGVCESAYSIAKAIIEKNECARLLLCSENVQEIDLSDTGDTNVLALALANAKFNFTNGFDFLANEAMLRQEITGAAVFVITRITPKYADVLMRLKLGLMTELYVILVTDRPESREGSLIEKMKNAKIHVEIYNPVTGEVLVC